MIEYVEIRESNAAVIGIIDIAKSIIWRSVYFGVGDFEIYAPATLEIVDMLKVGRYVTRPDNTEVGIIESISISTNEQDGTMIIASGRFAKSILDRRLIYNLSGKSNKATILRGNVEVKARELVENNAISCAFDSKRNIPILELGELANIPLRIVDAYGYATQKQVSYQNLLTYSDGLLEEYGLGATCILNGAKLQYVVYQGADRSKDNSAGNAPIIFSQEFDNLTASEYAYDSTPEKNAALIGGAGEGADRFYSLIETAATGLQRREMFIDATSIAQTYTDENEVVKTYPDEEYKAMLDAKGKQDLSPLVAVESFSGTIDATNGNYVYGRDFALGDVVTVQDNNIGVYVSVRIREATEVQDENGYTVELNYQ